MERSGIRKGRIDQRRKIVVDISTKSPRDNVKYLNEHTVTKTTLTDSFDYDVSNRQDNQSCSSLKTLN